MRKKKRKVEQVARAEIALSKKILNEVKRAGSGRFTGSKSRFSRSSQKAIESWDT